MRFVLTQLFLTCLSYITYAQNRPAQTSFIIPKQAEVKLDAIPQESEATGQIKEMPKQGFQKKDLPNKKSFAFKKQAVVTFSSISTDFMPTLLIREMPQQRDKKIENYSYPNSGEGTSTGKASMSVIQPLIKGKSMLANPLNSGTPTDNDIAVSDSGIAVSVVNASMYIKNIKTNAGFPLKSLNALAAPLGISAFKFDPKVIYDPDTDRFIVVFLAGSDTPTSKVILGFSQTNDPNGSWNLYSLPGNPLNNNLWTDYPMIAMTKNELFLTVNLLYNDSSWQTGFVETLVWQIKKKPGYVGDSLASFLHSNIKFNGKAIRNLCPVKGGSKLYSPNMYFLSNRNLASVNDTVFLVNITDTIGAASNSVTVKVMVSPQAYYFPPDGRQTIASQSLATNDCRNLGAFFENAMIQYVHNTKHPISGLATIYYGVINKPDSVTPVINGYMLGTDSLDFAYPNISYSGLTNTDNSAVVSFNHSSNLINPGCSAVQVDGTGNFSPRLKIQDGASGVNLLQSNLERWGDYSGSQRIYSNPGEVWISGYYGYYYSSNYPNAHAAWMAQIYTDEKYYLDVKESQTSEANFANVYPNPSADIFQVELNLEKPEHLTFELLDYQGKLIALLAKDLVKVTQNVFSFNTSDLSRGTYFLKISGNNRTQIIKKIVLH